jgi:hypothetical protein
VLWRPTICPLRLLWRVRWVRLEPESIGAEIDLAWPFETAPAFTDVHLCKDRRISDGGKDALAHQMIEAVDRLSRHSPRST